MKTCFLQVRKRAARTLQDLRLLKNSFKTFRHRDGSMIAHYTYGNAPADKRTLGHKRVEDAMKYIPIVHFKDDEIEAATATKVEEVKKLASAGFKKVNEIQEFHLQKTEKIRCFNAGLGCSKLKSYKMYG
jgi:type I site-specific restriction-modification system R (restriction) subunit